MDRQLAEFGKRLRKIRKVLRMSYGQMHRRTGLTEAAICMYEHGKREPSFRSLVKLSNGLGVSIDYLVFGEEIR